MRSLTVWPKAVGGWRVSAAPAETGRLNSGRALGPPWYRATGCVRVCLVRRAANWRGAFGDP